MAIPNGKFTHPGISRISDVNARQGFDSLTSYLGGWQDYVMGGDVISFLSGSYTKGNATSTAEYLVRGDICFYRGQYLFGNTTSFPGAGALMLLNLPVPAKTDQGGSDCFGGRAVDSSAGQGQPMEFVILSSSTALPSTMGVQTFVTAAVPFTWASGDALRWNFWYRVQF